MDAGLLVLRLAVGAVFAIHGGQKLFEGVLPGFAAFLASLHVPIPAVAAVLVALVEFVGGVLLVIGLFARPAAVLIAADMTVAVLAVHLPQGFFNPRGFEYPLTLFAVNVALACLGAGAWSMDGWVHSGHAADRESRPVL